MSCSSRWFAHPPQQRGDLGLCAEAAQLMKQTQPTHNYTVVISVRVDAAYVAPLDWQDVRRVALAAKHGQQLLLTAPPLLNAVSAADDTVPPVVMGTAVAMQRVMQRMDAAMMWSSVEPLTPAALWAHALRPTPVRPRRLLEIDLPVDCSPPRRPTHA
jgi:hypothetical protein